jgi:SRSO17 transposase
LDSELLDQVDRLVGGKDAVLVIDDTAMPKKGDRLVGVGSQYASSLGKTANCQTLVSLTLARGEVPGGTTSLHSRELDEQSGAFEACERSSRAPRAMRFGCVLADAGYRRLVDT